MLRLMLDRHSTSAAHGVELYIPSFELFQRPAVEGYAPDSSETHRADDAIWAEEFEDGSARLIVTFAEGGLIDRDGSKLAESIDALASGHEPNFLWLPRQGKTAFSVSQGDTFKPSVSVELFFTPDGDVISHSMYRSKIRAEHRDRQDFAEQLNDAQPGDELWALKKVSRWIRSNPTITDLSEEGWTSKPRNRLSDFSIIANVVVSRVMYEHDRPWLYRSLDPEVERFGDDLHDHEDPELISRLLGQVTMALFTEYPRGHYWLGFSLYGHATGQLRDLPNLVNGVMLTSFFDNREPSIDHDDIETLARWLNTSTVDGGARRRFPDLFTDEPEAA